jgi:dienelactone hydrolase
VPVVHFANGTLATCENYRAALERLASHGFLSVCFESPATGNGNAGLEAFEAALQSHPDLADRKLGSAGHDQGGQGAFVTLQLAEAKWGDSMLYAGLAAQPSSGNGSHPDWKTAFAQVKSPMFIFSGSADMLVNEAWVEQSYEALSDTVEAYLFSAVGATHIPVPITAINQVSVAWFRWKLLGDQRACQYLNELPDGEGWDRRKQQNARACSP